ncbi:hypothetical protein [Inquilinus sp. Marseille-Q2685]|uniref:hypothetical protein n=1 Tax=Inquilinus sp. Marseille-Q2685 TaxID=2866581 RepID=UPI001CE47E32|nr:hypothetical protein [Inquilinus sp. Marseille-Q2685]
MGNIMWRESPYWPDEPVPSDSPRDAELDRSAEERSENEGMAEHLGKSQDPAGWELDRAARIGGQGSAIHASGGPVTGIDHGHARRRYGAVENTDLERRVLAHEQILQALIAHMAETEPEFINRLNRAFNNPDHLSRREHDYTDTAQYAEQFVREVIRLGEGAGKPAVPAKQPAGPLLRASTVEHDGEQHGIVPTVFLVAHQAGRWTVTRDGQFYGHYFAGKPAQDAAQAAIRAIIANGGSAVMTRPRPREAG